MERSDGGWVYFAETGSIDLNELLAAQSPSMRDQVEGSVSVRVDGSLRGRRGGETSPIYVLISVPAASFSGVEVENVSVPISVSDGSITISQGSGTMYNGEILFDGEVNLSGRQWGMSVQVAGLDIGKAASPFLEQGGLAGSANANISVRGDFGVLMMMFANGDFRVGEGKIYGFDALRMINNDGMVPFEEVRGSFFWDGNDLWLNPGTQVTAVHRDYLYRFLAVSGSMGLGGRPLRLDFNGNFNVEALNMVLGAMRGVFDLTTGSLTGGRQLIRQALGRVLSIAERDFQDVSFQLRGTWSELHLLNLSIGGGLEGFVPVRDLDSAPTRRRDNRRIQFNINIPIGQGGRSDESAADQFKRQLLDNLLDWTLDPERW